MKRTNSSVPRTRSAILLAAVAGALLPSATFAQAAADLRGSATAVSGIAMGASLSLVNSGTISVSSGAQEASSVGESVSGVFSAGALHATAIGQANTAATETSVADVSVSEGGAFFTGGVIAAAFVISQANAACFASGATATGLTQVSALIIDQQSIAVSGQANQMVMVNGNIVIVNEQFVAQTGLTADITVNALHIMTITGANLIFGASSAGVTCGSPPPTPPPCSDFVTGGGWITGTPSGAKANFGVAGGIKNGAWWGHLNYIDHGNGMHVKQMAVTGYQTDPGDQSCRLIDYSVAIDGLPGSARVRVCDKGEPGKDDIFEIRLSSGYAASGDLGGSRPGGGNIQLHQCR